MTRKQPQIITIADVVEKITMELHGQNWTDAPYGPAQIRDDLRDVIRQLESEIYYAIFVECESMEFNGNYVGNGHHLAQRLANLVQTRLSKESHGKHPTTTPVSHNGGRDPQI